MSDEIKANIDENGVQLSIAGSGAESLSKALADIVSPFSESLGMLGDTIRRRRLSAVKEAGEEAKRIIKDEEKDFSTDIKYLAQWAEAVSYEFDSQNLKADYARLLANSTCDEPGPALAYLQTLKVLSTREAELLKTFGDAVFSIYKTKEAYTIGARDFEKEIWTLFEKACRNELGSNNDVLSDFELLAEKSGFKFFYFSWENSNVNYSNFYDTYGRSLSILNKEGCIEIMSRRLDYVSTKMDICWGRITNYGIDFYNACTS